MLYQYDGHIYLKTFYKMASGENFYVALQEAALADRRIDKLDQWISGTTMVKMPTTFYMWRLLAGSNGINIFYLSLVLTMLALVAIFYALDSTAGMRAASLGAIFVAPYLYICANWDNILFPDWWAALFGLIGIALYLRKNYIPAAVVVTIAALMREPMGLLIVSGILAGIIVRNYRIWLPFSISLLSFVTLYLVHNHFTKVYVHVAGSGMSTFYHGIQTTAISITTSYLAFPISMIGINMVLPFLAIAAAFYLKDWEDRILVATFLGSFTLFLFIIQPSSYWGQMFMPVVLVFLPLLLKPVYQAIGKYSEAYVEPIASKS